MRKFTKFTLTLALLFGVLGGVKAKTLNVNLSALPTESENTTWNSATNTFAWSATSYNSMQLFGAANYFGYTTLNLNTTAGTADHFRIIIQYTNGTGQTTITPVNCGEVSVDLAANGVELANMAFISSIRLSGANDATGNITITSISLEGPDVTYIEANEVFQAPTGTTDLNGMTGAGEIKWTVDYPKDIAPQTGWLGNIDNDGSSVDISTYDYLHFVVTSVEAGKKISLRVFTSEEGRDDNAKRHCLYPHPIADVANVTNWESIYYITEPGIYVVKISAYPLLRGFKAGNGYNGDESTGRATISLAYVSSSDPVNYTPTGKYILAGETIGSATLTDALADANATFYDATNVTGTDVDLTTAANPNALFKANAGVLANDKNVIVDGVCANLELTDEKPFKAPTAFTATAAKFTKTVTAAGYATMVIPFGVATLPEGVEVYELSDVDGETIISCNVDAITKECPVMIKAAAGSYNFTAAGAEIAATAEGVVTNGLLNGGYATITVDADANNYVLQKNGDDVNFYLVTETDATVKPFRAYLTAPATARELTLNFGETTGISAALMNSDERIVKSEVYNLNGQRVAAPQKGLYIVNGKKVIVK